MSCIPGPSPKTAGRADDVAWLLQAGTPVHAICERLNTTPAAMARWLYRNGHRDLARPFEDIARETRTPKPARRDKFPRHNPKVRAWCLANGYPLASCDRVTKAGWDAWQAHQDTHERAAA